MSVGAHFLGVLQLHDLNHILDGPDLPELLESNEVNSDFKQCDDTRAKPSPVQRA